MSRDHNVSLVVARHLEREPTPERLGDFLEVWKDELEDHFFEEERILLPFTSPEESARLLNEHMTVRCYAAAGRRGMLSSSDIVRLGGLIFEHVRWEERTLFPSLEQALTPDELERLGQETAKLEDRRKDSPHAPRRGELTQRR